MEAAVGNHTQVVKQLIQSGCHVNVMDKHGYTALSDSVCSGQLDMIDTLLAGTCISIYKVAVFKDYHYQ